MKSASWCVVKVGGSLLDLPDLQQRLRCWLAQRQGQRHLFVAGGGAWVDQLRSWDRRYRLDPVTAHWLAIDCMQVTAALLHTLLPEATLIRTWDDWQALEASGERQVILDVKQFLQVVEPTLPGVRLVADWRVSSDSIAARVATAVAADALVLLKSRAPVGREPTAAWADENYVDVWFPQLMPDCADVAWVNLRDDQWAATMDRKGD